MRFVQTVHEDVHGGLFIIFLRLRGTVKDWDAQDDRAIVFEDGVFAVELGLSVDVGRGGYVRGFVRCLALDAGEDVVGGDVDQEGIVLGCVDGES